MYQDQQKAPRNLQVWFPFLFAIILVAGMLIGMQMRSPSQTTIVDRGEDVPLGSIGQGKIEELIRYIEAKYVDEVDREELIQEAIDNILKELDPHSNYITAEQLREVNEQLEGNFDGIGVEFMLMEDTIVVVSPLSGGPSEMAGIKAGDKIVQIEDSLIAGNKMKTKDVINMLRGERGSQVIVGVLRNDERKIRNFTITRDKIPMHSVDIAYMLDANTGYIKINRFSATTYEEFMQGMEKLVEDRGMKNLVIDLRQNPGGYLQQATNILSQLFKEKEKLLVYTEGRSVNRNDYETTGRAYFDLGEIVILIDEGSASASEILAGAVQDHDRGIIVGRRSFGKGLVQEQYKLRDGSALRLTVARYYTPSGRSIQKSYEDLEQYENDVYERYNSGELSSAEQIAIVDSTRYYTDNGRIVYGGGGVTPDIFIPIDTLIFNDQYLQLRQYIPQFVYRFIQDNDSKFDFTLENFKNDFQVSEEMFNQFLEYAHTKDGDIGKDLTQVEASKEELKRFMKARIAKHLYDDIGFYQIWNENDQMLNKALELLEKPNPFTAIKNKQ